MFFIIDRICSQRGDKIERLEISSLCVLFVRKKIGRAHFSSGFGFLTALA